MRNKRASIVCNLMTIVLYTTYVELNAATLSLSV